MHLYVDKGAFHELNNLKGSEVDDAQKCIKVFVANVDSIEISRMLLDIHD